MIRVLHAMLRAENLVRSLSSYPAILDMKLLHGQNYPGSLLPPLPFFSYGRDEQHGALRLTQN